MIKNNKIKKNWSEDDLQILVWLMSKYLQTRGIESHEAMVDIFLFRRSQIGRQSLQWSLDLLRVVACLSLLVSKNSSFLNTSGRKKKKIFFLKSLSKS